MRCINMILAKVTITALPPHSAERLRLSGRTILHTCVEAKPRRRGRGGASLNRGHVTVRQSLTAVCGGEAASSPYLASRLFQEPRIKRFRQQLPDVHYFALSFQIRERNLCVLAVLPNDLTAGTAGWRQLVSVHDDDQIGKVSFTFGQGFPNRHAFSTDGQAIARAFNVAPGENLSRFSPECRPHKKPGKRRQRAQPCIVGDSN